MKKAIYLAVLTVITILCCVIGLQSYFGDGFSVGLFPVFSSKEEEHSGEGKMISKSGSLEAFSNLEFDLNVMDVTIEEGNACNVTYECNREEDIPTIEVKEDTLVIRQKKKVSLIGSKKGTKGVNRKCKLILTLPAERILEQVLVSTGVGDISISNLEGKDLEVDTSTGEIVLEECHFSKTSIIDDVGYVKLTSCD